ncbi:hypothetical protein EDB92DRAFT_566549 [Lactarius akahatsu]|uniref:Uncharacterized protein n=1 Tax=Lactarius akahatsu TaxID=416441 RepID=A0AAD4QE88_9AGAM|nr:hypothetical protein EDB92DRAFT_566549 [Lactarius akahatsu]
MMGCIPSKQTVLQGFDEHQTTAKGRTRKSLMKFVKWPKSKKSRKPRPPSLEIPADAAPWVTGHAVMTVHQDGRGDVYLTEKNR